MARTWSAPHWGSFVTWNAAHFAQSYPFPERLTGWRRSLDRVCLLAFAALMTGAGIAVPLIDSSSLQTLLFLAGAGLAGGVLFAPWPTKPLRGDGHAISSGQFAELVTRPRPDPIGSAAFARLTAQMSHELRTPLNAVLGFSELMASEVFGPLGASCYSTYARDIHASGRVLLKSAEDALAITGLLTGADSRNSLRTCCLASVAGEAVAFARHDLAARILDPSSSDTEPNSYIHGDGQAVRQLLINLLFEASRNAKPGATLHVTTTSEPDTLTWAITVAAGELGIEMSGSDFPLTLARTLCELSGARLTTGANPTGDLYWSVCFQTVSQNDLF